MNEMKPILLENDKKFNRIRLEGRQNDSQSTWIGTIFSHIAQSITSSRDLIQKPNINEKYKFRIKNNEMSFSLS